MVKGVAVLGAHAAFVGSAPTKVKEKDYAVVYGIKFATLGQLEAKIWMNHFLGRPINFPVLFSIFSWFHQYSWEMEFDVLCIGSFGKHAASKH